MRREAGQKIRKPTEFKRTGNNPLNELSLTCFFALETSIFLIKNNTWVVIINHNLEQIKSS